MKSINSAYEIMSRDVANYSRGPQLPSVKLTLVQQTEIENIEIAPK